ncbi:class I SAM-dependent methyltransferase [Algiphilus aromaticivorans]|jgi:SAM-dependent methyltransferase|uniref:class I SAM-dependent methyltransferase n=1 Tax=Algiphilus aromaticivorans TaxID=382454 RepID=UPI0005C1431B|nr:class I SAM-dependent methyltransferase [Algiphilus aromaticivorans]
MEEAAYAALAAEEAGYWWYRGRRAVVSALIHRQRFGNRSLRILDAGCGTGGNLAFLGTFGEVDAFEPNAGACRMAARVTSARVFRGRLPDELDRLAESYQLITLLDVLEHVGDDVAALTALGRRLSPDGRLILTVPAYSWLWSGHDVLHHHKRRYTVASLRAAISAAGMDVIRIGYFNSLLFPLALMHRIWLRTGSYRDAIPTNPPLPKWLNECFAVLFGCERYILGWLPFPFGLSIYAVVAIQD